MKGKSSEQIIKPLKILLVLFLTLMMTVRGYNLSWDSSNRSAILLQSIKAYRESYTDVMLVTEDGQMFRAHKLVLASSSSYFHELFQMSSSFNDINQSSNLLVALQEVKGNSLASVLSFIYDGQTQVLSSDIDLFTKTAKKFKVKGLTAEDDSINKSYSEFEPESIQYEEDIIKVEPNNTEDGDIVMDENIEVDEEKLMTKAITADAETQINKVKKTRSSRIPENAVLTETVIIEKGNLKCPSCNFETKKYELLTNHLAIKHKQKVQFKCNKCDQLFEVSNKMLVHYKTNHVVIKPKSRVYSCHQCSYRTFNDENLDRHLQFTFHENEISAKPSEIPSSVDDVEISSFDLELD